MSVGVGRWAHRGPLGRATVRVAVVVFVVLAGLIGMHGLGSHQMSDTGAEHGSAAAGVTSAMPELTTADVADVILTPGVDRDGSPLNELCIAVLTVVGVALLLARARQGTIPVTHWRATSLAGGPAAGGASGRGPPTLAQLSVLRC